MFEHILGNEPLKAYLQKALQENRLAQTLLFTGPEGIGKSLFAKALAAQLLKSDRSPDLHILAPEGKSGLYAIDTLREMIETEHAAPYEAPGKVFILEDAERMQPASSNALLKTLEEPNPDTTFILLTQNPTEMLPTILSRCTVLSFQPLKNEAIAALLKQKGHPEHLAKLAHGSAARAFELVEQTGWEKLLFQILAQRPSYPELTLQLEKLAELVEEEDPVKTSRRVELLFSYILMWNRDQQARELGITHFLFFPEEPPAPPFKELSIDRARLAYQRNMKLSVCLLDIIPILQTSSV